MMGRRPKGLYSISELILLHLARFPFLEDNFSIPDELSQEGIALGVGIQRSHVPRYISKLILSGDIEERKGRLIISGRRKKVYVLTEKGIAEVKKLLERYYQYQKINSHTLADGEAAILKKLQEMPSHQIPFPYTRSEVNNCGNEGQALYVDYRPNTLNINNPHETIEVSSDVSSSSSLFCFSDYFAGRKEEINILTNGVSSQHSILYIYGPPGIGKTALISYFCKNYLKDREKFIYNIPSGLSIAPWDNNTESSSLKSFLLHFNRYLNTGGRFSLPVSLLNNTELNIHDAAEIISGILKTCGMVLVIDDFNNINSPCDTFFHFITILAREEYNVAPGKIILIGRNKGTFYDARDVVQKRVLPVELRGLSMPEMEKIVFYHREHVERLDRHQLSEGEKFSNNTNPSTDDIPNSDKINKKVESDEIAKVNSAKINGGVLDLNTIYKLTEGHPAITALLIEHFSSLGSNNGNHTECERDAGIKQGLGTGFFPNCVQKYIEENFFIDVSSEELELLKALSIFENDISMEDIFIEELSNEEKIELLLDKFLLNYIPEKKYHIPSFIKSYLNTLMSNEERKRYSIKAGEHYLRLFKIEKDLEYLVKAMKYFIVGGREDRAFELSSRYYENFILKGRAASLLKILEQMDLTTFNSETLVDALIMKGELFLYLHKPEEAHKAFIDALALLPTYNIPIARTENNMSGVSKTVSAEQPQKPSWEIEALFKLDKNNDTNNRELEVKTAKVKVGIGFTLLKKGKWAEAEEVFKEIIETMSTNWQNDAPSKRESLIIVYHGYGESLRWQGKLDKAKSIYTSTMQEANSLSLKIKIPLCVGYAEVLADRGELRSALRYLSKVLELIDEKSDVYYAMLTDSAFANIYIKNCQYIEAITHAEKAKRAAANVEYIPVLVEALLLYAEAQVRCKKISEAEDALKEAVSLIEKMEYNGYYCSYLKYIRGLISSASGKPHCAIEELLSAARQFESLKMPYFHARCLIEVAVVCREINDISSSKKYCMQALKTYRAIGANRGVMESVKLTGALK